VDQTFDHTLFRVASFAAESESNSVSTLSMPFLDPRMFLLLFRAMRPHDLYPTTMTTWKTAADSQ
jgi:hypothetical protein